MTWKHFLPLIGFVLPTAVIGFGVVIPLELHLRRQ